MHAVTTTAQHVRGLVGAAFPADTAVRLMAGLTLAVLFIDGRLGMFAERRHGRAFLSRPDAGGMIAARAMARFALTVSKRGAGIALACMRGLEDRQYRIFRVFVMAFQTGICTLWRKAG